jgi:hypothetical protein
MNQIKKTLFTLNVDNYAPEICEITYPLLKRYAEKIGADFFIIDKRVWPDMPPVYEKLQIRKLAEKMKNDWNVYIDSDALVHPETIDFTSMIGKDTVMHNGHDMASIRWKYDEYFLRDGRNIGSCNWFTIASNWCLDLWNELDIPYEEALANIYPIPHEKNHGVTKEHLIDDYTLSRNIAKYGLRFETALNLTAQKGPAGAAFFYHEYTVPIFEKVRRMKRVLSDWEIDGSKDKYYQPNPKIQGWMEVDELQWLYENAQEMESIVEVGCWKGRGTHALASGCKGVVYSVDTFKGSPDERESTHAEAANVNIKDVFESNALPNVKLNVGDSVEIAKQFAPKSIDMVFIDGDHSEEGFRRDVEAWKPVAKKLLCGHDSTLIDGTAHRMGLQLVGEVGSIWSTALGE